MPAPSLIISSATSWALLPRPATTFRRFDNAKPATRRLAEAERRLLLDTYRTFGCENSHPPIATRCSMA